eukprot:COSAG06_NODE_4385_length_4312_cov_2.656777_3_plen_420_part_00
MHRPPAAGQNGGEAADQRCRRRLELIRSTTEATAGLLAMPPKLHELTADSPPKLVARIVAQALKLTKALPKDALPKDVLAEARKARPHVKLAPDLLPKDALLAIAQAVVAEQKAAEAAAAKAKRDAKRAKARSGAPGELPPSESSEEEEYYEEEQLQPAAAAAGEPEHAADEEEETPKFTTDRFGNTITVEEAERRKAEQAEREAAAARRAARAAAADEEKQAVKADAPSLAEQLAVARAKLAAGEKLGMREKKLIKKHGKEAPVEPEPEPQQRQPSEDDGLEAFSFSLIGGGNGLIAQEDAVENDGKGGRDIIVDNFSISAPSMPLFVGASLQLVHGRKYGLLGPNGRGKTTLLRFLAARRMPLPPNTEVLLVQQEVESSTETVVQQVCAADVKGVALAAEEVSLLTELESMEDDEQV